MASYILQCLFYLILAKNDIRCNPPFSPYGARISKSIFIYSIIMVGFRVHGHIIIIIAMEHRG